MVGEGGAGGGVQLRVIQVAGWDQLLGHVHRRGVGRVVLLHVIDLTWRRRGVKLDLITSDDPIGLDSTYIGQLPEVTHEPLRVQLGAKVLVHEVAVAGGLFFQVEGVAVGVEGAVAGASVADAGAVGALQIAVHVDALWGRGEKRL